MAGVALDADVLIGFLDPADAQHDRAVGELRPRITAGDRLIVSASVYAEILVRPLLGGTGAIVDDFLDAVRAEVVPVDRHTARLAAQLRARHSALRLPDAFSLATALVADAQLLTLDETLRRAAERESAS
jgi:predicted nucleic acid-binding protein